MSTSAMFVTAADASMAPADTTIGSEESRQTDIIYSMAAYAHDIYEYNVMLARRYAPSDYMHRQLEVNESMRAILVDWLVDGCVEFHLDQECLYLAVNYVDRFLTKRSLYKKHLQLLGAAAIMVAA